MNRKERKKMRKICNAKDLVCKTCIAQLADNCKNCPIANLVDNELRRINGAKLDSGKAKTNDFADIVNDLEQTLFKQVREMKAKPSPCLDCKRKGCGAYHDVCPKYQEYTHDEIDVEKKLYRYYIEQTTWNNRRRQKKRGN